ncbi:bromodomain adjacent to zinc finger domain protein 2B isoform X1 [Bicyclus anynana]|uniref:Bromodomain adjacent to zinc finger domain protein 2B isoform X1 n=2 Tax=Bicyclus anynana TaxID=110368 RepID=A0ABM3LV48_BICAN|nr:bromodomain adjacent to zinc finger domain protein 2B isoform X1 [Bicyclus anynana]XP_052742949.1 bromodomain adjacent to zinc finger domain protein 2B isoform X1 [Bicyclus anynana]XP_052742950.1 bromodomain adjacent to zinc finger domain protein 2B isoform X1 [Bicyclus anynana]
MDKENGEGDASSKQPPDGLLDPAGLFGAYWGRDGGGGGAAAQAQAQAQAALFGFGSRYPPPTTLGVAANQAASLGLHPAASAAWWSMASHLAAQDYLARLQASGLNFPHLGDPYAALSALSGSGMKQPSKPVKQSSRNDRSNRSSASSVSAKDKSPSTSTSSSQPNIADWGSTYGFPKTSSPSTMPSQSMSSLASLNNLAQQPLHSKSSKQPQPPPPRKSSSSSKEKERDVSRGDLMLHAAHSAYHAALAAAKGKNMSSLYPFGVGSEKDRRGGIDALTGLPHTILSDPSSVLGGVRLPPDTEIIKYTSSLAGPKSAPGSTNRGRKKTISLDPPHVSVHPPAPTKRQKVDEYGNSRSSVEVIRLPNKPERGANSVSGTPPPNLSDYAGISRELLQTIASQSGVSLAALERQLAGSTAAADSGLNLSTKSNNSSEDAPMDLGLKDDDAPLNLSLKPTPPSSQASDALSRLTSLSSSLSASNDRISRRKPGAKPRRVAPEVNSQVADSPRPKSSGSEDSESVSWPSREGRPRNLGRGVSKPKKNTVASLLAQSRALGLRPALAQQLLAETDLDKLRALLGESVSTDSECPSDSNPSDSDASDGGRRHNDSQLRLPLALGWKRVTVIKGLSRNCNIKGDVSYTPPEPHAGLQIKSAHELHTFLEANPSPPLCRDNFSLSARTLLGEYIQPSPDNSEPLVFNEAEITKRLEEARALAALSGRPTPPPLERRMELARRQQAAREARKDAGGRGRDQASRLVRDYERSEKAEYVKREKEARSQHLLEQINKNRSQLTIEALPTPKGLDEWKMPEIVMGPATKPNKDRTMPQISLSLIPVSGLKENTPIKTMNLDHNWKETEEYNALDKMKDFAEKAAFDLPKRQSDKYFDFSLIKTPDKRKPEKENNLEKLIESYSRISEFINGCNWSKLDDAKKDDPKSLEQKYLDAKNEFMTQNLMLMPKDSQKSVLKDVIDLSGEDEILTDLIAKNISKGTFNVGKDGALSISVQPMGKDVSPAKKRKQEELEKQKIEEQAKKQQEREIKRQQSMLLKEQQKFITEERERRRQHTTFIRQLDSRRRWEERERRKHQNLLDRLLVKEKKLQQRRKEMELLSELRRPQEDSSLSDQKSLPDLHRIPGLKIPGQAMADLLQVFEFLHNFGQALGFEVDSLPTLNSLQMGLIPNCSQEAEEDLLSILTRLLVIAIEEPGIPHPGRHTTLLGHALRLAELTPATLSEVLRIYLYANATAEIKALTGLTVERERDRRVADHHQTDAEIQLTCATTKNGSYYEHLHNNATYKLSELLRDKPFVALNPSSKARILARVCDELLQSRAVLRQLDASLDHLAQLRRDRYLLDTKIRKVRVLQQRKARAEATERQQALALERMHRLVDDSSHHASTDTEKSETPKKRDKESSPHSDDKANTPSPYKDTPDGSDKELSPLKELSSMSDKEMMNNNKDDCSPHAKTDSVMGDCDAGLSEPESEGTQPEEDEDKNLSSEELARKLEKLTRQSEQQLIALAAGSHALRATCYGQDRYWRRYWSLGKSGGVFVEAMESAQPEILDYQAKLEEAAAEPAPKVKKAKEKSELEEEAEDSEQSREEDEAAQALELRSIKSELNLSDRTQIIKYEPNVTHGACKVEGSIKMEEKYIQQQQSHEEEDMLDIEDSIPTAFLVQKPTHKPMFATQAEPMDKPQEIIKVENVVKTEEEETEENKDNLVNNLEELRKLAEAVSSQLDAAKKAESEKLENEAKNVKTEPEIKSEVLETDSAHSTLYTKMLEGKWFSILRHESSFLTSINEEKISDIPVFCDNEHTCSEVINCQGHKWDVSNNLHLLNDPSLFTLNSMVTSVQVPSNMVYSDSSLTMSGLGQEMLDSSVNKESSVQDAEIEEECKEQDNDLEKELQADANKELALQKAKASNLSSLGLLNFNALSTYVTCDSPPPIQMSPEELEQLEHCKVHGMPVKIEGSYVPKDLRYGWWRITEEEQLKQLLEALHPRGVRERELHASFLHHLATLNNKLYIDHGDSGSQLSATSAERLMARGGGYPTPDEPNTFCAVTARRVDMQLLATVEALEERVAAASIQVKGWRATRLVLPSSATGAEIVARARHKLASLEAHIERRYLKPPLVQRYNSRTPIMEDPITQSTTEATLGAAVMQGEHGNAPPTSPHPDTASDTKTDNKGIARGLATWREAVSRCNTSAQLAMLLQALESAIAWDKSIMKANCQFCLCGDNEDQLLLCDGCDKGYHTYCFKPRMEKIPEGDWYCWECVNKARGGGRERVCIVCGGSARGRALPCALCVRAFHLDCHYPPLLKMPRGKWYCSQCISRAPPKKPRKNTKRDSGAKHKDAARDSADIDAAMVPSPAASHASTSTTAEEAPRAHTPDKEADKLDEPLAEPAPAPFSEPENGINHDIVVPELPPEDGPPAEKRRALQFVAGNGALQHDESDLVDGPVEERESENLPLLSRAKKEKNSAKKQNKDMQFCKNLLCEMECHEHAWPFLVPVNTKQFPQYRKVIKCPMDLSTIKRKLHDSGYKCKEEFASDVRLIFSNCEVFNEDYSPVGRAGHFMRQFFEERWLLG